MGRDFNRSKDAGYPVYGPYIKSDEQTLVWIGYPDEDTIRTEEVKVETEYVLYVQEGES